MMQLGLKGPEIGDNTRLDGRNTKPTEVTQILNYDFTDLGLDELL